MKRIIALLLCFVLAANFGIVHVSAEEATSGTWGQLTWVLDAEGTLTISGEGEMKDKPDYPGPYEEEPWDNTKVKTAIVEEGITSLGLFAFTSHDSMTKVVLPSTLTKIGHWALSYCPELTYIEIPDTVTAIGKEAFRKCEKLTEIYIPKNVSSLSNDAFRDCTKLEKIEVAEDNPYYYEDENCVIITETKTLIISTTSSIIPKGVVAIGNEAFYNRTDITELVIPVGVESIGSKAFEKCENLEKLTIPDTVAKIGESAFSECRSLKEVVLPNKLEIVSSSAFYDCGALTHAFIPDSVVRIEKGAFAWCTSLNTIIIPDSVESLESGVFAQSALTEINIPKSVTNIGSSIFAYCQSLAKISIDKDNPVYHVEDNCIIETASKTLIASCNGGIIPYGVVSIGQNALQRIGVKFINIPSTVTDLGGHGCFEDFINLEAVIIPTSITKIPYDSFYGCKKLKTVYYTGSEEQWNDIEFENNPYFTTHKNLNEDIKAGNIIIVFNYTLPKGDANGDLVVDNLDASTVLKYDAGINDLIDIVTADYNEDGVVDNLDATWILKYDAGLM